MAVVLYNTLSQGFTEDNTSDFGLHLHTQAHMCTCTYMNMHSPSHTKVGRMCQQMNKIVLSKQRDITGQ